MISCAGDELCWFYAKAPDGGSEAKLFLNELRQWARASAMTRTTTTDLAEWLGGHGLGQYAKTFAENNIDYSVLPDLTENDLEKLGVSS